MKYDSKRLKGLIIGIIATIWGIFWIYWLIYSFNQPADSLFGNLALIGPIALYYTTFPIHIVLVYLCAKNLSYKFNIFSVTGILTIMAPILFYLLNLFTKLISEVFKLPNGDKIRAIIGLLKPLLLFLLWIASFVAGYKIATKAKKVRTISLFLGILCLLLTIIYMSKFDAAVVFTIGSSLFIYIVTLLLAPYTKKN